MNTPETDNVQEIDLVELAKRLWSERKFLFKCCGVAIVVGLVVAFSIPKEYSTTVKLALLMIEVTMAAIEVVELAILSTSAKLVLRSGKHQRLLGGYRPGKGSSKSGKCARCGIA